MMVWMKPTYKADKNVDMLKGWVDFKWTASRSEVCRVITKAAISTKNALYHNALEILCSSNVLSENVNYYLIAKNFGGNIFWRIAENMSFGGIYFGGEPVLANDIHIKNG